MCIFDLWLTCRLRSVAERMGAVGMGPWMILMGMWPQGRMSRTPRRLKLPLNTTRGSSTTPWNSSRMNKQPRKVQWGIVKEREREREELNGCLLFGICTYLKYFQYSFKGLSYKTIASLSWRRFCFNWNSSNLTKM